MPASPSRKPRPCPARPARIPTPSAKAPPAQSPPGTLRLSAPDRRQPGTGALRHQSVRQAEHRLRRPGGGESLNRALLQQFYDVREWDIPDGYLCPPIPGRADYLHYLADLLGASHDGLIPRGPGLRALDVGTGANCIYPLLGHHEYGWRFVGADIDPQSLASAAAILAANPRFAAAIELRRQLIAGRYSRA